MNLWVTSWCYKFCFQKEGGFPDQWINVNDFVIQIHKFAIFTSQLNTQLSAVQFVLITEQIIVSWWVGVDDSLIFGVFPPLYWLSHPKTGPPNYLLLCLRDACILRQCGFWQSISQDHSFPPNRACAWQGPFCHLLTYSLLRHCRVTIFGVRNSFSSHRMAPDTLSNDKHPHQLLILYMLSRLPSNKFQSSPVITYVMCP